MKLAPNFDSSEFFVSSSYPDLIDDWDSIDGGAQVNLRLLAQRLQVIRDQWGPIKITSGYRGPKLNKAVGGAENSRHTKGLAADIVFLNPLIDIADVAKDLARWHGGFHYYPNDGFIHVDIGPYSRW